MLSIIPILIVNSVLNNNNKKEIQTLAVKELELESQNTVSNIDSYIENLNKMADFLCANISTDSSQKYFQDVISFHPEIKDIVITDKNIQNYSYYNYDNTSLLTQLLEDKTIQSQNGISRFFVYGSNNDICFAIVDDVNEDFMKDGELVLIIDMSEIKSFFNIDQDYNYTCSLVDFAGNVTNYPFINILNSSSNNFEENISDYINEVVLQSNMDTFQKKDTDNEHIMLSKCKDNNLYVYTKYDSNLITSKDLGYMLSYISLIIILIATIILISILYVDYITKPINNMLYYINNRKDGDKFAQQIIKGPKDFRQLCDAYKGLFDELSNKEQKYRTIVEMSDNVIFEYNIYDDKVIFSSNFNKKFSFRPKSTKYTDSFFELGSVHPDDAEKFKNILNNGFKNTNYIYGEYRFLDVYNEYVWYLLRATLLYDSHGNKLKIIGCFFNVNNAKESEISLIEQAKYDSLTNLLNRETFMQRLEKEKELSFIRKNYDAILFVDIDDFKRYNDDYNHAVGDEVLTFIGNTIKAEVEDIGFAGRYGGDEFIICLNTQSPFELAPIFAENLIKKFGEGYYSELAKVQFNVKCSIGISFFSSENNDIKSVTKNADEAMYRVKRAEKSNYSIYL